MPCTRMRVEQRLIHGGRMPRPPLSNASRWSSGRPQRSRSWNGTRARPIGRSWPPLAVSDVPSQHPSAGVGDRVAARRRAPSPPLTDQVGVRALGHQPKRPSSCRTAPASCQPVTPPRGVATVDRLPILRTPLAGHSPDGRTWLTAAKEGQLPCVPRSSHTPQRSTMASRHARSGGSSLRQVGASSS